jgi:flagellar hook assembly protein FlgD
VRICNSLGQTIRSWPLTASGAGDHLLAWDLRDSRGTAVAPGIYYLQVRQDGAAETRMVQVLR